MDYCVYIMAYWYYFWWNFCFSWDWTTVPVIFVFRSIVGCWRMGISGIAVAIFNCADFWTRQRLTKTIGSFKYISRARQHHSRRHLPLVPPNSSTTVVPVSAFWQTRNQARSQAAVYPTTTTTTTTPRWRIWWSWIFGMLCQRIVPHSREKRNEYVQSI